jgi:hypothetical protein
MGKNLEESGQELYNIYVYGDRETVVSINHKILSPNLGMNRVTPVHEAGVAATRPQPTEMRWKRVLKFSLRPSLARRERDCCVQ